MSTYETLESILVENFGVSADEVTPETTFADLELDSLDLVELSMAVEDRIGVGLADDEVEQIASVGDAVKLIEAKVSA
jgi:acyl carrier protein